MIEFGLTTLFAFQASTTYSRPVNTFLLFRTILSYGIETGDISFTYHIFKES
jgi:hypothetical protein